MLNRIRSRSSPWTFSRFVEKDDVVAGKLGVEELGHRQRAHEGAGLQPPDEVGDLREELPQRQVTALELQLVLEDRHLRSGGVQIGDRRSQSRCDLHFREVGPRGAFILEGSPEALVLRFVPLSSVVFERVELAVSELEDLAALPHALVEAVPDAATICFCERT